MKNKTIRSIILPHEVRTKVRTFLSSLSETVKEDNTRSVYTVKGKKYTLFKSTGTFQYPIPLDKNIENVIIENFLSLSTFPQIGTDESGKGDLFGPLVVAGVYIDKNDIKKLLHLGIKDSKKIRDTSIQKIKQTILKQFGYEVVLISSEKYNQLHAKMGNVNKILAWAHARVIENLLKRKDATLIIVDKFAGTDFIERALFEKARTKEHIIVHRAEEYLSSALASMIARIYFLDALSGLSKKYGIKFPKGAGKEADNTLSRFIELHNHHELTKVAKLHFHNITKIPNKDST